MMISSATAGVAKLSATTHRSSATHNTAARYIGPHIDKYPPKRRENDHRELPSSAAARKELRLKECGNYGHSIFRSRKCPLTSYSAAADDSGRSIPSKGEVAEQQTEDAAAGGAHLSYGSNNSAARVAAVADLTAAAVSRGPPPGAVFEAIRVLERTKPRPKDRNISIWDLHGCWQLQYTTLHTRRSKSRGFYWHWGDAVISFNAAPEEVAPSDDGGRQALATHHIRNSAFLGPLRIHFDGSFSWDDGMKARASPHTPPPIVTSNEHFLRA